MDSSSFDPMIIDETIDRVDHLRRSIQKKEGELKLVDLQLAQARLHQYKDQLVLKDSQLDQLYSQLKEKDEQIHSLQNHLRHIRQRDIQRSSSSSSTTSLIPPPPPPVPPLPIKTTLIPSKDKDTQTHRSPMEDESTMTTPPIQHEDEATMKEIEDMERCLCEQYDMMISEKDTEIDFLYEQIKETNRKEKEKQTQYETEKREWRDQLLAMQMEMETKESQSKIQIDDLLTTLQRIEKQKQDVTNDSCSKMNIMSNDIQKWKEQWLDLEKKSNQTIQTLTMQVEIKDKQLYSKQVEIEQLERFIRSTNLLLRVPPPSSPPITTSLPHQSVSCPSLSLPPPLPLSSVLLSEDETLVIPVPNAPTPPPLSSLKETPTPMVCSNDTKDNHPPKEEMNMDIDDTDKNDDEEEEEFEMV